MAQGVKRKTLLEEETQGLMKVGSKEEQEYVEDLRKKIADSKFDLLNFTAEGKDWLDRNHKSEQQQPMDTFNKIFQRRMMILCLNELKGGVNMGSLASAVGLYVGVAMVDPNFHKEAKSSLHRAAGNFSNFVLDSVESGRLGGNMSPEKRREKAEKLRDFRDKHIAAGNDGRLPYSPESAAMTGLKIAFEGYRQLNENKGNPEKMKEIQENIRLAQETLYGLAAADGVSKEDINQHTRLLVGHMSDYHPEMKYLFSETAYDGIMKSDPYEQKIVTHDKSGRPTGMDTIHVWTGEFNDGNGNPFTDEFHVRVPMNRENFVENLEKKLAEHNLDTIRSAEGLQNLNMAMSYIRDNIGRMEGNQLPLPPEIENNPTVRQFTKELSDYANCYYFDTNGDVKEVFNGLAQGISKQLQEIHMKNPDLMQEWNQKYGSREQQAGQRTERQPTAEEREKSARASQTLARFSDIIDKSNEPSFGMR